MKSQQIILLCFFLHLPLYHLIKYTEGTASFCIYVVTIIGHVSEITWRSRRGIREARALNVALVLIDQEIIPCKDNKKYKEDIVRIEIKLIYYIAIYIIADI